MLEGSGAVRRVSLRWNVRTRVDRPKNRVSPLPVAYGSRWIRANETWQGVTMRYWPEDALLKMTERLPAVSFDTEEFEDQFRFDALRDFLRGVWLVEPMDRAPSLARCGGRSWRLDTISATDCEQGPLVQIGGRGTLSEGKLQVRLYSRGRSFALFDDEVHLLEPGAIHICDSRFQCHTIEPISMYALAVPFELVGHDPGRHGRHVSFPIDRPAGRALASTMIALFDALNQATASEGRLLEGMLVGMLQAALSGKWRDETAQAGLPAARAVAMKAFLVDHLEDVDLGLGRLCRDFNVSRATIYRAFEADGGVDRFIQEQRLDRVLTHLASTDRTRGYIARAARRWNFHDPGSFNRSFRRRYGCSPGDVPRQFDGVLSTGGHDPAHGAEIRSRKLSSIFPSLG